MYQRVIYYSENGIVNSFIFAAMVVVSALLFHSVVSQTQRKNRMVLVGFKCVLFNFSWKVMMELMVNRWPNGEIAFAAGTLFYLFLPFLNLILGN